MFVPVKQSRVTHWFIQMSAQWSILISTSVAAECLFAEYSDQTQVQYTAVWTQSCSKKILFLHKNLRTLSTNTNKLHIHCLGVVKKPLESAALFLAEKCWSTVEKAVNPGVQI